MEYSHCERIRHCNHGKQMHPLDLSLLNTVLSSIKETHPLFMCFHWKQVMFTYFFSEWFVKFLTVLVKCLWHHSSIHIQVVCIFYSAWRESLFFWCSSGPCWQGRDGWGCKALLEKGIVGEFEIAHFWRNLLSRAGLAPNHTNFLYDQAG
jgi:hypothetical protein